MTRPSEPVLTPEQKAAAERLGREAPPVTPETVARVRRLVNAPVESRKPA